MAPSETFAAWAPEASAWHDWAKPVLFAQLPDAWRRAHIDIPATSVTECPFQFDSATAVIVDLPGSASITLGIGLARSGWRLVPLFNGAAAGPSPALAEIESAAVDARSAINVWPLIRDLYRTAPELAALPLTPDAPPAFLLDARRRLGKRAPSPQTFDNRWVSFPTDFPSARMLLEKGITATIVISDTTEIQTDLTHTLLRWQQAGIPIHAFQRGVDHTPRPIIIRRPKWYRAAWYQFVTTLGLRRRMLGGFGANILGGAGGFGG